MDVAFGWLGDLIKWLVQFVPRVVHVNHIHRGVRFVRGREPVIAEPGMRVYWPFTTELIVWPVNLQVLRLSSQTLRTADKQLVEIEILVSYTIHDPVMLFAQLHDPDSGIGDLCLGAARQLVGSETLEHLEENTRATDSALRRHTEKLVANLGIKIKRARFISIALNPIAHKHFGLSRPQPNEE